MESEDADAGGTSQGLASISSTTTEMVYFAGAAQHQLCFNLAPAP